MGAGAIVGAVFFLGLSVIQTTGITFPVSLFAAVTVLPIGLCGAAGFLAEQTWQKTAAEVDRRYQLRDRTVSALQFADHQTPAHELQLLDAACHLEDIRASEVAPIRFPPVMRWAGLLLMAAFVFQFAPANGSALRPTTDSVTDISESVEAIEKEIDELNEIASDTEHDELKHLAERLKTDLAELNENDGTLRDKIATMSEMQEELRQMAASLNVEQMETQLSDVADALAHAKPFENVKNALKEKAWSKAAAALDSVKAKELDRTETRPTGEALAATADSAKEKGLDEISESLDDLAESVKAGNAPDIEKNSLDLADQIRKHDAAKKMKNMLNAKVEMLARGKKLSLESNSEGNGLAANATGVNEKKGNSEQNSDAPSRKAGGKSSGNKPGEKTQRNGELQMARLTGRLGTTGDSEKETIATDENDQTASRLAQESFAKYKKMSEAVLQSEPVPPGHRATIQRYFEGIRPAKTR